MASATCLPHTKTEQLGIIEGQFDETTVSVIKCGTTIENLMNNNTIESLSTLSVLTSAPEVLSEEDIRIATGVLETQLQQSTPEVKCKRKN